MCVNVCLLIRKQIFIHLLLFVSSKDMKRGGCGLSFFIMSLFSGTFPLLLLLLFLSILLAFRNSAMEELLLPWRHVLPVARRRWGQIPQQIPVQWDQPELLPAAHPPAVHQASSPSLTGLRGEGRAHLSHQVCGRSQRSTCRPGEHEEELRGAHGAHVQERCSSGWGWSGHQPCCHTHTHTCLQYLLLLALPSSGLLR